MCLQRDDGGAHDGADGQQVQVQRRHRLFRQPRNAFHRQLPMVQRVRRCVAHPLCAGCHTEVSAIAMQSGIS